MEKGDATLMKPYAFGIDIGGTTVKCGFFKADGTLIDKWEIPTRTENDGELILPDITDSIRKKLAEQGASLDDVEGVGVGVPGPVLKDGTVNGCINLGWGVVNIKQKFMKALGGVNVEVGNDANIAALGEQWHGGGEGHDNVVMLTLGTGVGGGIIINGKIYSGAHGAGGELGHIVMVDDETEYCACGKRGCIEQYASAPGIAKMAKKTLASRKEKSSVLRKYDDITSKDVFDAAKEGDEIAVSLVEWAGSMLGRALSQITVVVDPEVIVIGGGVSKAGKTLIDVIEKYYKANAFHACRDTEIRLAKLGNDAGIYGAVRMVLS